MPNTEWQLSGNMAERYEEYLVPVIFVPWAKELLARAGLEKGDRLLDLACGTGIVARTAAQSAISAVGSDINTAMLAVAKDRSKGLETTFEHADAQDLPFPDHVFDAVICQQGLQFFPDKEAAVAQCFRVIKPGGQAIFCMARGLDENPLMQSQVISFGMHLGAETTGAIEAVCEFSDPNAIRSLFAGAGFDPVQVETVVLDLVAEDATEFVQGLLKSTPVADRIASMDEVERQALSNALLEGFKDHFDGSALRFPHSANVVVAKRPD